MNKWHGGASDSGGAAKTLFPVIFDSEGNRVCNVDSWPEGNAEGNYERILLCVNTHDALVAVLTATEWAEINGRGQTTCPVCHFGQRQGHHSQCKLGAALAAAKGEKP